MESNVRPLILKKFLEKNNEMNLIHCWLNLHNTQREFCNNSLYKYGFNMHMCLKNLNSKLSSSCSECYFIFQSRFYRVCVFIISGI